jgi:hypothetical protein
LSHLFDPGFLGIPDTAPRIKNLSLIEFSEDTESNGENLISGGKPTGLIFPVEATPQKFDIIMGK